MRESSAMTDEHHERADVERSAVDDAARIVVVIAEYAAAGVVGNEVHRLVRRVRRDRALTSARSDSSTYSVDETVEWAAWIVEARYLPVIVGKSGYPAYVLTGWTHEPAKGIWRLELEFAQGGIFEVELFESEGGFPNANVTWAKNESVPAVTAVTPASDRSRSIRVLGVGRRARLLLRRALGR